MQLYIYSSQGFRCLQCIPGRFTWGLHHYSLAGFYLLCLPVEILEVKLWKRSMFQALQCTFQYPTIPLSITSSLYQTLDHFMPLWQDRDLTWIIWHACPRGSAGGWWWWLTPSGWWRWGAPSLVYVLSPPCWSAWFCTTCWWGRGLTARGRGWSSIGSSWGWRRGCRSLSRLTRRCVGRLDRSRGGGWG